MQKTTIYCDLCGKEGALTSDFILDRGLDAAGSSEDKCEWLDLCQKHTWEAYKLAEKQLSYEERQAIFAELSGRAGKYSHEADVRAHLAVDKYIANRGQ